MGGLRLAHLTTVDMSLRWLLAAELAVDVEAGFEVFGISAPGPHVDAVEALGVTHVAVPELTRAWDVRRDLAAARALARRLGELDLDILHTHNPKTGALGRVLGRVMRIPIVVNTCHGIWARPDEGWRRKALVYGVEAVAAQFSHAELYQNDAHRQALRRFVRAGKARTVGNGTDLKRFCRDAAARARVRAELGVGNGEILVGGVGRLVAEKGIAEFAQVARSLSGSARFCWVGPTDVDKPDALGELVEGVDFLGLREDMPAIYSALDVFVLPSWREGFSRSAMEAAACGCAMVLTDIDGCRPIGQDGEHLLFVSPRDPDALLRAVSRLVGDAELRARLAAAAETRAKRAFDQRAVAAASLETYRQVALRRGVRWATQLPDAPLQG